ncbi:autotransporter outer membrane beta-barrel domain-containing protein [Mesorhizobium sp. BH1-1-5]|uniref:autotransporter outer membrane beta-barrel domain-containing protein n=1 Tax=Mesorhizobium sp. BH1-1-5 TaxID=2876661 RepID=UPI001CCE40F1|nr:autotransporter outer membrane beta-barrel domain-containing protein [Mesorhizobium sp. BH1-1-5]MBZ9988358.1 autotransporter outer membrane beta-barrel domain-containing protein [Mesorhizobium sp. BH1-1-5]
MINQNGADAPNRGPGGYDEDGVNGGDGGAVNDTNNADQLNVGASAYVGTANGGKGGNGGYGGFGTPIHTNGGEGGNGGHGGTVDITNNADLSTTGDSHSGIVATAIGGRGGDGGGAAPSTTAESGDAGNGGAGGTASATASATSSVTTTGNSSYGIYVDASGGNGGQGGDFDAAVIGAGGNGGNGASGGSASASNAGLIDTSGTFSYGMLVRSAGGNGGNGKGGLGIISEGGNGGAATIGGTVEGTNTSTGSITTRGDFASGLVVQSVGGGGGGGGGAFGLFGGGGAGAAGNDGGSATGTNDGKIETNGTGAIGMLVESVGGGGGDGGGAAGIVSIGGTAGGGGIGGTVTANVGGTITTGADGSGDGAHGVLAQSVGGGGGNGGYGAAALSNIAVAIGGGGGTGGNGGAVNVNQAGAGASVSTHGSSAVGILAQSVGGGGGNGGGSIAAGAFVSVAVGGSGAAGGDGGEVTYKIANATVNTNGSDSTGILAQSVGGGGGNGGFALSGAGLAAVGVGGQGSAGGVGKKIDVTSGGKVETQQQRSAGIIAQSIGGGGGNGGFSAAGSLGASVGVGGSGSKGGDGGQVFFRTPDGGNQTIITHGADSTGLIVQSIGGGGGNGGFAGTFAVAATVGIGGGAGAAGAGVDVHTTYNGSVETFGERSAGIIVQSIGGGGGNGGGVIGLSAGITVGVGGSGAGGGGAGAVEYHSASTTITTHEVNSAGLVVQSIGGGGGNGGFSFNLAAGASVGVGGKGGAAGASNTVTVDIDDGTIHTMKDHSTGILAQSVGGGGGTGGGSIAGSLSLNVGIAGNGAGGGNGNTVDVTNGADITTDGVQSHGIQAQSIGGGGGSGGFSIAVGGPSLAVGGAAKDGGSAMKVTVINSGVIKTNDDLSVGILAQAIGGGGGDGGLAGAGGLFTAVGVGGKGGGGGNGAEVEVTNTANITTKGDLAHGIMAQSVGGGGGNGGNAGAVSVGAFVGVGVAVGGDGGVGRDAMKVTVDHTGDITVSGMGAKGIIAQAIGGGGGNGGKAVAGAFSAGLYASAAVAVTVGGSGGNGGSGGEVFVKANGKIVSLTDADGSGGIVAQSIGGGGGNGGRATSIAGAVSDEVTINVGVAIGGSGGNGGQGNKVTVETGLVGGGQIVTKGFQAVGILAQSIGGGGGNGGDTFGGAGGYGNSVTVAATVNIGGKGGGCIDNDPTKCNSAGDVHVNNAMTVSTEGDSSSAIVAQSIGGGGGNGGTSTGGSATLGGGEGVNVTANFAMGGGGGTGGFGNTVDVINSGNLTTTGAFSSGIMAQSIGGGGGIGGSSTAKSYNIGGTSQTSVSVNMGLAGSGGGAANAMKVTVNNTGIILTSGFGSTGIMAMSVGGGGGAAGAASASDETVGGDIGSGDEGSTSVSIGVALALPGGTAGDGGQVSVTNNNWIITDGAFSYGISASSIGGGGGVGGSASAGATAEYAIGGAIAGGGGSAGNGALVEVTNNSNGVIWTKQENSIGVFAQSIGGGGGSGGAGKSTGSDGGTVDVKFSMGGLGAGGGDGGEVHVTNSGIIETDMANSHGIMAQSIGGSGGVGGAAASTSADAKVSIAASLGGLGGHGGVGKFVHVINNSSGVIQTNGDNSYGIFAQSIGGGGGAAGSGSTTTGAAEDVSVSLSIGGIGGAGSKGGDVTVENHGEITTYGYLSHGIFAQSVGGGGGASGAAANATDGDTKVGGQVLALGVSLPAGVGADGGHVIVTNDGVITTNKDGAIGIFAQSIGGGGGYGGTVSSDAAGDSAFALQIGGFGGRGGNGGQVEVTVSGLIETFGERAHGVVAQSIGGGGGYGGDASGKTSNALAIGGLGGDGGDGGNVTVKRTGEIITHGKDSIAIIAQSVGGGGGFGGAGFGRFGADDDGGGPNAIGFNTPGGTKGTGGTVTIIQSGAIETDGDRAHGIVAQAVGGGGGAGGNSSLDMNQSAAGSQGGIGDAAAATASTDSQVWVKGASSYAMFGQSATGQGNSNLVHLTAGGSLFAQGADSVAAYGESTAQGTKGNITMDLQGQYTIGGANTGVAVMVVGGQDNTVNNNSLLYAMGATPTFSIQQSKLTAFSASLLAPGPVVPDDAILESLLDQFSPLAVTGTSGNETFKNKKSTVGLGRVIGNVDLGGGLNEFDNFADSSFVGLKSINLGAGGLFKNQGLMTNQGIGVVATIDVTGGWTQDDTGSFVTDIDLNNQITDKLVLTETGDFDGTAPLNFLSIDKLFTQYTLASGSAMTDSGITAQTLHPAVGFNFLTRVDNGTDLVLYADNPTFLELAQDPGSGTTDPGVFQMAQYLDDVEAASSPDNPMARLINMLRFSQTDAELGAALTRLTPHYAVHTFDMINRATDTMLDQAHECTGVAAYKNIDGRCIWGTITPQAEYSRDAGAGTTSRNDTLKTMSLGGIAEVGHNWSLGATIGRTEYDSKIGFNGDELSDTKGESWQAYALAKYENNNYFVDVAVGGGTGSFRGERDTHIDQVGFIPGETLDGVYLPEELLDGIGNSVTYKQDTSQFSGSARVGMTRQMGAFYLQPTIQFDARWLDVSGKEEGSVAAFSFDGSDNMFYAVTPALEVGADIPVSDIASFRIYGKAGVEFSTKQWEIEGRFAAAENLPGNPALHLTEAIDSPLYRVGAGLELNGVNGVGLAVRYNGAFGETVKQNAVSASLKVSF